MENDAPVVGPDALTANFQDGQTGHCDRGLESANFSFARDTIRIMKLRDRSPNGTAIRPQESPRERGEVGRRCMMAAAAPCQSFSLAARTTSSAVRYTSMSYYCRSSFRSFLGVPYEGSCISGVLRLDNGVWNFGGGAAL